MKRPKINIIIIFYTGQLIFNLTIKQITPGQPKLFMKDSEGACLKSIKLQLY